MRRGGPDSIAAFALLLVLALLVPTAACAGPPPSWHRTNPVRAMRWWKEKPSLDDPDCRELDLPPACARHEVWGLLEFLEGLYGPEGISLVPVHEQPEEARLATCWFHRHLYLDGDRETCIFLTRDDMYLVAWLAYPDEPCKELPGPRWRGPFCIERTSAQVVFELREGRPEWVAPSPCGESPAPPGIPKFVDGELWVFLLEFPDDRHRDLLPRFAPPPSAGEGEARKTAE